MPIGPELTFEEIFKHKERGRMILGDTLIRQLCLGDNPIIDPFDAEHVQPASYDLTLGDDFLMLESQEIEMDKPVKHIPVKAFQEKGLLLYPGSFILGTTVEKVNVPVNLKAQIDGRSSIGRLGLTVHSTAGFLDPGFQGRVTLEITNHNKLCPIWLKPGRRICQVSFFRTEGVGCGYGGRGSKYQGQETVMGSLIDKDVEIAGV